MLLLLIRHAIAEERGIGPDALRALTEEGRQKIERAYPHLSNPLKDYSIRLISSPLVRARQTGEVLQKYLGVEMELADWLATGEFNKLLRAVEQTEEDILMCVGHEPILSDWCERLGFAVGWMKKGSVAFFEVNREIQFLQYLRVKDFLDGERIDKKLLQDLDR